jgi:hypothetical protein
VVLADQRTARVRGREPKRCLDELVPNFLGELTYAAMAFAAILLTLYWVIRLAVQHALRDHRRAQ